MRLATLLAVTVLFVLSTVAYAEAPPTTNFGKPAEKIFIPSGGGGDGREGGETIATAVPIPGLPYTDTGNTCDNIHDYDEVCPYTGSLAPDVVYSYSPAVDEDVFISLCNSYYDTKLFVYQDAWTPGAPYACNDDACSGPNYPYSYLSYLGPLTLVGGHTYYIVVDGYGSGCGQYVIDMDVFEPCVECPANAHIENEPECYDYYAIPDTWNGGCNSTPAVFEPLDPVCLEPLYVCGYGGTDPNGMGYRDTDWYEISLTTTTTITYCGIGEMPFLIFLIDGNYGCVDPPIIDYIVLGYCTHGCVGPYTLNPGKYWLWAGPSVFYDVPCAPYLLDIWGYVTGGPSAAEETTWGTVKSLYR